VASLSSVTVLYRIFVSDQGLGGTLISEVNMYKFPSGVDCEGGWHEHVINNVVSMATLHRAMSRGHAEEHTKLRNGGKVVSGKEAAHILLCVGSY